jgi:integrase
MVLIPGTRKYRSRNFDTEKDAKDWAKFEAAGIVMGKPSPVIAGAQPVYTREAVEDYLAELKSLGRAESTLRDLSQILGRFAEEVPRIDGPGVARQLHSWMNNLVSNGVGRGGADENGKGKALSPARRNKYLVNIRALCRWCQKHRGLIDDPTELIRSAQVDEKLKAQFNVDEMRQLLVGDDSQTRRWVLLMVYAGLRADEARMIRWRDFEWSAGMLMVKLDAGAR